MGAILKSEMHLLNTFLIFDPFFVRSAIKLFKKCAHENCLLKNDIKKVEFHADFKWTSTSLPFQVKQLEAALWNRNRRNRNFLTSGTGTGTGTVTC